MEPWKNTPCRLWTGATNGRGYGQITMRTLGVRKMVYVHRRAWEQANGPIPPGLCVLHHCDTPACYEPAHLFLGTKHENTQDAMRKGRMVFSYGGDGGTAKLTSAQVTEIRAVGRFASHPGGQDGNIALLASRYGVTYTAIRSVLLNQTSVVRRPHRSH